MSNGVSTLNKVKYSGLDFDTYNDDLRARMQIAYGADYNDFVTSGVGMMLLDVTSFGLDTLSFYLDRRVTDSFLDTVRTRRSMSSISRQLGYKMQGAVSSSTDLQVGVKVAQTFTVPIPQGFQFQGPNGLVFETAKAVDYAPGEQGSGLSKTIPAYEGTTLSESFTSDGSANQIFKLKRVPEGKFIAFGSVNVKVDGSLYEESDFIEFQQTDQYEVAYAADPPQVRFGDSVAGNIPKKEASIVVTYVVTSGKAGKVSNGTILKEVTALVVSGKGIALTVTNPLGSSGGDDTEDLERVRSFAGRKFKSRQVAITRPDYEALAGSFADPLFGRVAVAQAISSRSAQLDLELQVYLQEISSAFETPVATLRTAIADATDRSTATLQLILDKLTDLQTQLTDIATQIVDIDSKAVALVSGVRADRNKSLDVQSQVLAGKAAVDAITTDDVNPSILSTALKNTIKGFFDNINSSATAITGAAQTRIDQLGVIQDDAASIGVDLVTSGTLLYAAETDRAGIGTLVGTSSPSTGLWHVFLVDIQGAADSMDPNTSADSTVADGLAGIEAHVDKILSADCKANLVTVPILAKDAAGFYSAPSNALVNALQNYLDARKEETQNVRVVSGASFLVKAVISVSRVGIKKGFSPSQVKTAVEASIDGVLRGRKFGVGLYVSDLDGAIKSVSGTSFTNVTIDGYMTESGGSTVYTDLLDAEGNLVVDISQVITKGLVTVQTPETVVE